ncbi:D-inositol-3-phosphate glycosyltransferase [Streptomyces microflavus]
MHSHYWLSGQVGWLAAQRWGVPLVHAMHTMAKVKNAALAEGDTPSRPRASSARPRSSTPPTG